MYREKRKRERKGKECQVVGECFQRFSSSPWRIGRKEARDRKGWEEREGRKGTRMFGGAVLLALGTLA